MSARAWAMGLGLVLVLAAVRTAAAEPAPARQAEKAEWTVRLEVPAPGGKAPAVVHLAARAGFHVNLEYPLSFRPAAGARLSLRPATKAPCQGSPQDTCAITLELPLPVEGTLAFSVCTAERCLIEKVALSSAAPGAT